MPCPFSPLLSLLPAAPMVPLLISKYFKKKETESAEQNALISEENKLEVQVDNNESIEFIAYKNSAPIVVKNKYNYSQSVDGYEILSNQPTDGSALLLEILRKVSNHAEYMSLSMNTLLLKIKRDLQADVKAQF